MKPNVDELAKKVAEEIFYEWQRPQSLHKPVPTLLMEAFQRGYEQGRRDEYVAQNTRETKMDEVTT